MEQTPARVAKKNKGRPTVMNDEVINKLRTAFSYGCTDEEACVLAGISHQTLYSFMQSNPDFIEERDALKLKPILAARQMIVKNIPNDLAHARWYATKKMTKEFGDKLNVEHTVVHKVKLNLADPAVRDTLNKLDTFAKQALLKKHEPISAVEEPLDTE